MAISVISYPLTNTQAYNQMIFDVSTTNGAQPNFQFLCDVYCSGVLVSRLTFPKQPSVNTLKIDISPVVKNYVTYDLENVYSTLSATNTNSQVLYYVQFGEVYDVSGIPTTFADLRRMPGSGSNNAYNAIFDFAQFLNRTWASCAIDVSGFLSDIPENRTIKEGQDVYLSYYDPDRLIALVVIQAGATIVSAATTTSGTYLEYNLGITWDYLVANSLSAPALAAGSYTVGVYQVAGEVFELVSEVTVNVSTCADKFEGYRLHWLNQLGGWDSFNFDKASLAGMDIDRSQFKKILPLGYDVNDRLKTNYQTVITDNIILNSNWVSDDMADWLQGLLQSPIVIWESADGMIAVNLTDASYEIKKYLNGRALHNLTVTMQPSYNRYRQSL